MRVLNTGSPHRSDFFQNFGQQKNSESVHNEEKRQHSVWLKKACGKQSASEKRTGRKSTTGHMILSINPGIMHKPGSKTDVGANTIMHKGVHIMKHHTTTHSRPHAQAQKHAAAPIAAGCSHHFPASKAGAEHPGSRVTAHLAGRTKPKNGLARCKTAQSPLPEHTHASQHQSYSQHGHRAQRRHRAGGAPWVLGRRLRSSVYGTM